MKCIDVQNAMSEYLDDAVDALTALHIETHMENCPECASELEAMRNVVHASMMVEDLTPPPSLRSRIAEATTDRKEKQLAPLFFNWLREMVSARGMHTASTALVTGVVVLGIIAVSHQDINEPASRYISIPSEKPAVEAKMAEPPAVKEDINAKSPVYVSERPAAHPKVERHSFSVRCRKPVAVASAAVSKHAESLKKAVPQKTIAVQPVNKENQAKNIDYEADIDPDSTTVATSVENEPAVQTNTEQRGKTNSQEIASAPALVRDNPKEWIKEVKERAALRSNNRSGGIQVFSTRF